MANRDDLLSLLGRVPLFEGLSRKELEAILRSSSEVEHEAGHNIVTEGGGAAGFHLMLAGEATVLQGGREKRTLGAGDFFGEIALIDGGPRSATVRADTRVRTLSVTAWDFKPLLAEHPEMAHKVMVELCRRIRSAEAQAQAAV
jgi:CRP/FNR family transcriptional regulator, cyclic AMP receptor protein